VVLTSGAVDHVPRVATGPLQPPEAVQAVALEDFQFRLEVPPVPTVAVEAVNVTSGVGEGAAGSAAETVSLEAPALGAELAGCPVDDPC
jgi:hypothetical protein